MMGGTRRATAAVLALAAAGFVSIRATAQSGASPVSPEARVVGARSFSPMVENVDATAAFYARLGLKVAPPASGETYPWDTEEWHYDLHGAQAPRSQMRFMYATVPAAVQPATPLLVEPVEHRNIDRKVYSSTVRPQDPGAVTLVLLVRDCAAAAAQLPEAARGRVRRVGAYGGAATAMTVRVPGAHLVELLQLDPLPVSTAPAGAPVLGAWLRVTVGDLERTLHLYRDLFGLTFRQSMFDDAAFGGLVGNPAAKIRVATAILPTTAMALEFVEVTGVERKPITPRIQDPGAARLQLTVNSLEAALAALRQAGPSTVASAGGGGIVVQPQYRVAVASDLNGLFLVLTDRRVAPRQRPAT
jgi:catechol 2,3-dioxygenase-like lactoylglutathione lyase family enzyme